MGINKNINVVFMGTPMFAVPILEGLINNYNVLLVVCQPDREKDRKGNIIVPKTKEIAIKYNIPVFQPNRVRDEYQTILDYNPDIIITCAYGQIIPKQILDYPKYGCINVHGSLLPKLRGGAPIHWAIINGEKETGITIMDMDEKMDSGDIISQAKIDILESTTLDSLYNDMSYLGRDLLLDTLPSIIDNSAVRRKQDESLVSFGFNIKKEDEKIDFNKSMEEVFNLVRGLNSIPGAYTILDGKRVKVYEVIKLNTKYRDGLCGEIVDDDDDGIIVRCSNGYVKLVDIKIEGKNRCKVREYLNGINKNSLIGKVFN